MQNQWKVAKTQKMIARRREKEENRNFNSSSSEVSMIYDILAMHISLAHIHTHSSSLMRERGYKKSPKNVWVAHYARQEHAICSRYAMTYDAYLLYITQEYGISHIKLELMDQIMANAIKAHHNTCCNNDIYEYSQCFVCWFRSQRRNIGWLSFRRVRELNTRLNFM